MKRSAGELIAAGFGVARMPRETEAKQHLLASAIGCVRKFVKLMAKVDIASGKLMPQAAAASDFLATVLEMRLSGIVKKEACWRAWSGFSSKMKDLSLLWNELRIDELIFRIDDFCNGFVYIIPKDKKSGFRTRTTNEINNIRELLRVHGSPNGFNLEVLWHLQLSMESIYDALMAVGEPAVMSGNARVDRYVEIMKTITVSIEMAELVSTIERIDKIIAVDDVAFDQSELPGGEWEVLAEALELVEKMIKWICECRAMRKNAIEEDNIGGILTSLKIVLDIVRAQKDVFASAKCVNELSSIKSIVLVSPLTLFENLRKTVVEVGGTESSLLDVMDELNSELRNGGTSLELCERRINTFLRLETRIADFSLTIDGDKKGIISSGNLKLVVGRTNDLKAALIENFLVLRVQKLSEAITASMVRLDGSMKYPVAFMTKNMETRSLVENIRVLAYRIRDHQVCPQKSEIFRDCFLCFLDVFVLYLRTCTYDKFDEVIKFVGTLLPSIELIRAIFPVGECLSTIKSDIDKIKHSELDVICGIIEKDYDFMSSVESEKRIGLAMKAFEQVKGGELVAQLYDSYEKLMKIVGQAGEPPLKRRLFIDIKHYSHFFQLASGVFAYLSLGREHWRLTAIDDSFFKRFLTLAKTLVRGEDNSERRTAFLGVLEALPVCRVPWVFNKGLLHFRTVGSKLQWFEYKHPECDCSDVADAYYQVQHELFDVLTIRNTNFSPLKSAIDHFWTILKQTSHCLYNDIRVIWEKVDAMVKLLETLFKIDEALKDFGKDLCQDLRGYIFEWIYSNMVLSAVHTMSSASAKGKFTSEIADGIDQLRTCLSLSTVPNAAFDPLPIVLTVEAVRQSWSEAMLDGISSRARVSLITFITFIGSSSLFDKEYVFQILARIDDLLNKLDTESVEIDKFSILIEIRDIFPQAILRRIQVPNEVITDFMKHIDYGLLVLTGVYELGLCSLLGEKVSDRIRASDLADRCQVKDAAVDADTTAENIMSILAQMQELENIGKQGSDELQTAIQKMGTITKHKLDSVFRGGGDQMLGDYTRKMCATNDERIHSLLDRREEYEAEKAAWVKANEPFLGEVLNTQALALEKLKIENRKKAEILRELEAEIAWRKVQIDGESPNPHEESAPSVEDTSDPCNIEKIRLQLALEQEKNEMLKSELAVFKYEFDAKSSQNPESDQDIERKLFDAVHTYRDTNMESELDLRRHSRELLEALDKVAVRTGKIRLRINAMDKKAKSLSQTVSQTRSALMELLEAV